MAFPICPGPGDNEAQFLIQDPFGLRRAILPLFEVDNQTQLLTGLGTAFRIDPYGAFLTAQHLVEHRISGHPHARGKGGAIIALVSPGMNLGRNQLPTDCFARLEQATTIVVRPDDPLAALQGRKPKIRNVFDCMVMAFDPSNERLHRDRSFLPLRLRGRPLQFGQRVMAIGFPELFTVRSELSDKVLELIENMYAAVGEVVELLPHGRGVTRPWPAFRVSAQWPSGMSGGPVFNEDGEVIGLVSASDLDARDAYAFWFEPADILQAWLPTIDPSNPGWFNGWAVVRPKPRHVAAMCLERQEAGQYCQKMGDDYEVRYGSSNLYGSDDFISHELCTPDRPA